ncbi:hypothetical protein TNCV_284311 [Trichonephila clavipes]|uniref:Uncharacterized protein n=1 Tax=Trichonephila clavipes TaxID=2585209 RepID=A0A8X6SJ10_TRICX|nr:hypothetical protein TNCV_284311 [Trichonephila clavipes]
MLKTSDCRKKKTHYYSLEEVCHERTNFRMTKKETKQKEKVAERLARHHTPDTTVDELWHRVEARWSFVPEHAIQSLFDSMPRRIRAAITAAIIIIITARGGCFWCG